MEKAFSHFMVVIWEAVCAFIKPKVLFMTLRASKKPFLLFWEEVAAEPVFFAGYSMNRRGLAG